ncbi:MAG: hypothetical protein PHD15_02770 [Clostridia bacterium]|nr:hypothetical protein [Clostridia bacterium]MDD4386667.1 hypothetical protein [Clostridia bacterium]
MENCKKRGITFIALVATVIIALIILSTVLIAFETVVGNTKKSEFAKEIYTVKKLVLDYNFMNSSYPIETEIIVDLDNINVDSQVQFLDEPGYATNSITLSSIDLSKAGVENIIRGTKKYGENDIYAFSTSTKKLYYISGEHIDNDVYYTLTEELYKLIGINDIK